MLDISMDNRDLQRFRRRIVPLAEGRVLEIGIGSGLNLMYYGENVKQVFGADLSVGALDICNTRAAGLGIPVHLVQAEAESLPFPDRLFDTVVATWTLCSIDGIERALRELRRTLKPCGQFLFVEHGRAAGGGVIWWQDKLTKITRPLSGGCRINRPIDRLIREAGFEICELKTGYALGYAGVLKPFGYMYEGKAVLREMADANSTI